jgi:Protein of unknown function (DUF742)
MTQDDSSRKVSTTGRRRAKPKRTTSVGRTGARFPSARVIAQNEPDGDDPGPLSTAQPAAREVTDAPENATPDPAPPAPPPPPPPPPPAGPWPTDHEQPAAPGRPSATTRDPASGRHSAPTLPSTAEPVTDWSPDPATPGPAHSSAEAEPHEDAPIGARFGPYSAGKSKRAKEFDPNSAPAVADARPREPGEPTPEQSAERTMPMVLPWAGAMVRPYTHTGGRTRASRDLAIEALVSTSELPAITDNDEALTAHHRRRIVDMCMRPRSVAEIAALLAVPLGVARVLLGDLATAGAVVVHPTASTTGDGAPDIEFMQRVLVGLRRL